MNVLAIGQMNWGMAGKKHRRMGWSRRIDSAEFRLERRDLKEGLPLATCQLAWHGREGGLI